MRRKANFMVEPIEHSLGKGTSRFAFMLRIGNWMLNSTGLYRWYWIRSLSGKCEWFEWVKVFP